jgi:hypothetical protein
VVEQHLLPMVIRLWGKQVSKVIFHSTEFTFFYANETALVEVFYAVSYFMYSLKTLGFVQ